MPRGFTSKDERIIRLLMDMNLPRNLARTIVFLSKNNNCVTADIRRVTELRQPEVSMAMQHLKERGWVEAEPIHRDVKGRPIMIYRLAVPFDTIISTIIKEERDRIKGIRENIDRLKTLIK